MTTTTRALEFLSVATYFVCDVMAVTSLAGSSWATSPRQTLGLWTYCYSDNVGGQPETAVTCTPTSKVENLGWMSPVQVLVTLGLIVMIASTIVVSGDVFYPVLSRSFRFKSNSNYWWRAVCRPRVYVTTSAVAVTLKGVGDVLFDHGLHVLKNPPVANGQVAEALKVAWSFIVSACSTGLLLVALALVIAARLILTPDPDELAAAAMDCIQPDGDGSNSTGRAASEVNSGQGQRQRSSEGHPPIKILRFSFSFPSMSRSTSITAVSIPTLDEMVADHEL